VKCSILPQLAGTLRGLKFGRALHIHIFIWQK
jgi:hypothetical protein